MWLSSSYSDYKSLDRTNRAQARRIAWSGEPSGVRHLDRAAYVWWRERVRAQGGITLIFIAFAIINFFVIHHVIVGIGMSFGSLIPLVATAYSMTRYRTLGENMRRVYQEHTEVTSAK